MKNKSPPYIEGIKKKNPVVDSCRGILFIHKTKINKQMQSLVVPLIQFSIPGDIWDEHYFTYRNNRYQFLKGKIYNANIDETGYHIIDQDRAPIGSYESNYTTNGKVSLTVELYNPKHQSTFSLYLILKEDEGDTLEDVIHLEGL